MVGRFTDHHDKEIIINKINEQLQNNNKQLIINKVQY